MDPSSNEQTELLRAIWNEMKAMHTNLGARIDGVRTGLSDRIDAVRTELSGRIDAVGADLGERIDQTNVRLDQTNARLFILEGVVRDLAGQQTLLGRYVRSSVGDLRIRVTRLETRFPEPEEG